MKKFLTQNWFKLALLVTIFWFLLILRNGIEINYKGEIDHSGWIENERPGLFGLPKLP